MFLTAILDFAEKNDVRRSRFSSILSRNSYVVLETFLMMNPKKNLLLQFVVGPSVY